MLKRSIRLPIIYFLASMIWQLIANKEVNWIDHIMVSILMFLFLIFYEWSKIPYKWKKDDKQ